MIDFQELKLIRKMSAGDQEAFAELYSRFGSRLLSYALRITGNRAEAEDLLQDTLFSAWQGRDSFRGRAKLLSWLLGIMSRRWRDRLRRQKIPIVSLTHEEGGDEITLPTSNSDSLESGVVDRITLDTALGELELPFREALLLIHSQRLTYREAAEVLNEPIGTVKWRVSVALRIVRLQLTEAEEELNGMQQTATRGVC